MIEKFADQVPRSIFDRSGKVFYSGRLAFSKPNSIYLLGLNPGGDPRQQQTETVASSLSSILREKPELWSAYLDESWKGRPQGLMPLQRRIKYLADRLGLDLRRVPSSNLIFLRSQRKATLENDFGSMVCDCWPFHLEVIQKLRTRVVVCLGTETGNIVAGLFGTQRQTAQFTENNARRWTSRTWAVSSGLRIVGLTHPGIADWHNKASDPTDLVLEALE